MNTTVPDSLAIEETLKAEGNALFGSQKFDEAIEKYGKAIAISDSNAILYANRAACYINVQAFGKAAQDGMKATELDPSYSKAWGRLARAYHAMQSYEMATEAWKRAVATLPTDNPSEKDKQFRCDYNRGLKESQRLSDNSLENISSLSFGGQARVPVRSRDIRAPWQCAFEVISRLEKRGITSESSAYVICGAHESLKKGLDLSKGGKVTSIQALTFITDGFLQDSRCLAFLEYDFDSKMKQTLDFAIEKARCPGMVTSNEALYAAFRALHLEGGYDLCRPAFSVGIRTMLYHAQAYLEPSRSAMAFKTCDEEIIPIIRWGQQEWQGVSKEVRGECLESTFLNGILRLRLEAYMMVCQQNKPLLPGFTLEGLQRLADEFLDEVRLHPPDSGRPGFDLAFGRYLEGFGIQVQAYCLSTKAQGKRYETDEEVSEGSALYRKAADLYFAASSKFPEDDEYFAKCLKMGLELLFIAGASFREILPLAERLRYAVPPTLEIWQFSMMNLRGLWQEYMYIKDELETPFRVKLSRGELNLDDALADPKKIYEANKNTPWVEVPGT